MTFINFGVIDIIRMQVEVARIHGRKVTHSDLGITQGLFKRIMTGMHCDPRLSELQAIRKSTGWVDSIEPRLDGCGIVGAHIRFGETEDPVVRFKATCALHFWSLRDVASMTGMTAQAWHQAVKRGWFSDRQIEEFKRLSGVDLTPGVEASTVRP